jgi:hypothetical protein
MRGLSNKALYPLIELLAARDGAFTHEQAFTHEYNDELETFDSGGS